MEIKLERNAYFFLSALCVIALFPWIARGYPTHFLMYVAMNIAFAQSWNLCACYAGMLSLGHAMFSGIGGYVTVVLGNNGIPVYGGMLIGAFVSMLFAAAISPLLMRLRAVFFAIGTMIICNALQYWFIHWREAGASMGMTLRVYPEYSLQNCYYFAWAVTIFACILLWKIINSKLGLAALALRDDIDRSETVGIPTLLLRTYIFAIGAFIAGLVGGARVAYTLVIEPSTAFGFEVSLWAVLAVVLGGSGTLVGPILGGFTITLLQYILRDFPEISMLLIGLILTFIMLFLPKGLISLIREGRSLLKRFR